MNALFQLFHKTTQAISGNILWCIEDGSVDALNILKQSDQSDISILTNRFDVYQAALKTNVKSTFNDWNIPTHISYDCIVLPAMKEKPVMHHLLNQSSALLKNSGVLVIGGEKNQGIKTYVDRAAKLFLQGSKAKKSGLFYVGALEKKMATGELLDTQNYTQPRTMLVDNTRFISKPGVFGWNKLDAGSALLVEHLRIELTSRPLENRTLLDLGCGWGALLMQTKELPFTKRIATDNNAAALLCAKLNCEEHNITCDVLASDAGDTVEQAVDIVMCNPPFHSGFDHANTLTDTFARSAARLLKERNGVAYFVVNSFIGLEALAQCYFAKVETLTNNKQFKVLKLSISA